MDDYLRKICHLKLKYAQPASRCHTISGTQPVFLIFDWHPRGQIFDSAFFLASFNSAQDFQWHFLPSKLQWHHVWKCFWTLLKSYILLAILHATTCFFFHMAVSVMCAAWRCSRWQHLLCDACPMKGAILHIISMYFNKHILNGLPCRRRTVYIIIYFQIVHTLYSYFSTYVHF